MSDADPGCVGLCANCRHSLVIRSDRGWPFYRCQLAATDPQFPKYPRLLAVKCAGYASAERQPEAEDSQ